MSKQPELTEEQRKELEKKLKSMSPEEIAELQKQQCIFCQIVDKSIPAKIIFEDEKVLAILDINPASKGHILLLPKEHFVIMPQISDDDIAYLFTKTQDLSRMLLRRLKVAGTSIFIANGLVAGQKAQHFMIHIIPRRDGDGIFHFQEKVIDAVTLAKIKSVLQPKLNLVLGIKTEEQLTLTEDEQEPAEELTEQENDEPVMKKLTKKSGKNGKKSKKEDVSLDDIADLFK